MPKVTVVVPIYGVEKYIARCARSLFEQTLIDMEFIFVNDCTKDNSMECLTSTIKDYPNRLHQIVILHHESNKGLSHARETGVKAAKGDYIGHCDSDDWVDPEMYEKMYHLAISGNYDFVKCGHIKTDGKNVLKKNFVYGESCDVSNYQALQYLLRFKGWNSIWDTLVKRELYSSISYTNNAMLEDFYVVSQIMLIASNIGVLNLPLYFYFYNLESICNTKDYTSICKRLTQAKHNTDWVLNNLLDSGQIFSNSDIIVAKWNVKNLLVHHMRSAEFYSLWDSIYPEINCKVIGNPHISFRNKVRFYFAHFRLIRYVLK